MPHRVGITDLSFPAFDAFGEQIEQIPHRSAMKTRLDVDTTSRLSEKQRIKEEYPSLVNDCASHFSCSKRLPGVTKCCKAASVVRQFARALTKGATSKLNPLIWSAAMIHASSDLGSIRDLNMSYLMLARRVLASDREAAQSHLGLSAEMADTLLKLSPVQTEKLASSSQVLCFFRMRADAILAGLAGRGNKATVSAVTNDALLTA
jgi:flagellar transcriptional activator FlhD